MGAGSERGVAPPGLGIFVQQSQGLRHGLTSVAPPALGIEGGISVEGGYSVGQRHLAVTIKVQLNAETKARLKAEARAQGLPLEAALSSC